MILETRRLILREMTTADAGHIYRLNLDPEVMRYTGDEAFKSVDDAALFLERYDDYRRYGYGRWAVIGKPSGTFMGWCGLKFHPDSGENDIGFRLLRSFWNCGFATEAARACIGYGFDKLAMPSIIGRAMRDNKASVRVLEKTGLAYERDFDFDGKPGVIYRIWA